MLSQFHEISLRWVDSKSARECTSMPLHASIGGSVSARVFGFLANITPNGNLDFFLKNFSRSRLSVKSISGWLKTSFKILKRANRTNFLKACGVYVLKCPINNSALGLNPSLVRACTGPEIDKKPPFFKTLHISLKVLLSLGECSGPSENRATSNTLCLNAFDPNLRKHMMVLDPWIH